MAKTSSQRGLFCGEVNIYVIVAKNIESTCFGRLCKVAKNIESTRFGWLYKVAKTSSQPVLVGYIKWRKHRVNVFW